jgi:hypothetical protein
VDVDGTGKIPAIDVGTAAEGVTTNVAPDASVVVTGPEDPVLSVVEGDELPPSVVPSAGGRIVELSSLSESVVEAVGIVFPADEGSVEARMTCVVVFPSGRTTVIVEEAAGPGVDEGPATTVGVTPSGTALDWESEPGGKLTSTGLRAGL